MNLYEINENLRSLEQTAIDLETGELYEDREALEARIEELDLAKDTKIENVILWVKDLKNSVEGMKEEKKNLDRRMKTASNLIDRLTTWVTSEPALNGEKFSTARCSLSYRRSEAVEFDEGFDVSELAQEFIKTTIEPKKTELKQAIKGGAAIPHVFIAEHSSVIIK